MTPTDAQAAADSPFDWTPGAPAHGADGRSVHFRVRVRARHEQLGMLAAYSNPVRVQLQ